MPAELTPALTKLLDEEVDAVKDWVRHVNPDHRVAFGHVVRKLLDGGFVPIREATLEAALKGEAGQLQQAVTFAVEQLARLQKQATDLNVKACPGVDLYDLEWLRKRILEKASGERP